MYIDEFEKKIQEIPNSIVYGYVSAVNDCIIECVGITGFVSIGSNCNIYDDNDDLCSFTEVVKFDDHKVYLIASDKVTNIKKGYMVKVLKHESLVYPTEAWTGRIINALAEPIDGLGNLPQGNEGYAIYDSNNIVSTDRELCMEKIDLGVKALNVFTPMCKGQKLGIFAGSGVGKSTLISMISKFIDADIKIIGLIGERGIEVDKFIRSCFSSEEKIICIVATSEESAFMRRRVAYLTTLLADFFRKKEKKVAVFLDSITRFAMARREIGLSLGEMPTSRGYTASVFSEIPKIIERIGVSTKSKGSITGFVSVLMEGEDDNEIIADTLRGLLDGHIILDRSIASKNVFPAINILKSISRYYPDCNTRDENVIVDKARNIISDYADTLDIIKLGLYKKGLNKEMDKTVDLYPQIEKFLCQKHNEKYDIQKSFQDMKDILSHK